MCEVCQALADTTESVSGLSADCPASTLDSGTYRGDNVVTIYFVQDGDDANAADEIYDTSGSDEMESEGWSDEEIEQFMKAVATISNYIDVTFEESSDPDADFQVVLDDNEFSSSGALGYFYLPSYAGDNSSVMGAFNSNGLGWNEDGGLEAGGLGYSTIIHEALHGLGLAHPHDGDSILNGLVEGASPFGEYGDYDLNQGIYTIMSYNDGLYTTPAGLNEGNSATPMALDIAILQEIYGANTTYNSGDNVYEIPDNDDAWISIWDTGGEDTISYSGTKDVTIDLREATLIYAEGGGGYISGADGVAGGYTIANGAVIENAIGGSGDDTLIGNGADNELTGNGGNDELVGGTGDDDLDGGSDDDTLYGDSGSDDATVSSGNNTIYGGSGFDDLDGGSGVDTIFGGSGDDNISGGGDDDTLYGGRGDDDINGDAGADTIIGGMGADTLTGGAGADTFVFNAMSDSFVGNGDTIVDFENGSNTIDLSAFGITSAEVTLNTSSGNTTVLIDSNGDGTDDMAILLTGTTSVDVANDFIF
ncbi:hypothetical protein DS901_00420 [Loktanella sp. D2R18]|uniref:M10 family metallopeptidase C-terminal domain-containing protein n=1 Tax=Rhodobacterales TaxID=204455 RepID=UPI000DE970BC|nr:MULTISPECIES: M10 family metallopeptidase C-terminal domain-containing protein [Rhodobacterales]MDO6591259.1 M10 family metallopeptidase C-terminal domain-containing protein [Yoonia sp. 1_MG-2023]RBW46214.1 hypothetical protein DS901_00420 [Loktanella sp. D2R18]